MKIVFIAPHFYPDIGGVEQYIYSLIERLHSEHSITVITSKQGITEPQTISLFKNVVVHQLPYTFQLSNTPINLSWHSQIRTIIKYIQPDVVNVHSPVPFMADVAIRAAHPVPVVTTYHAGSMKKGQLIADLIVGTYETLFLPSLFARSAAIAAIYPEFVYKKVKNHAKVSAIPPGTDTERFKPLGFPKTYDIAFVGRVDMHSQWKGIEDLIRAVHMLKQQKQTVSVRIIGSGDAIEFYKDLCTQLDVTSSVEFTGAKHGDDLVRLYNEAKIVVLPSRTESESFGMCLAEALACGTPVIGSDIGGIPTVIDDEQNGLLVPPKNPTALAAAISLLLPDETLRHDYGERGRQKIVSSLSVEHMTRKTEALLESVVQNGA